LKVGFIGFGEVASKLTRRLLDNDVEVISSTEGRSEKTRELAKNSLVTLLDSFEKVSKSSDILFSAVTPYEALNIAEKYGPLVNGIFFDLNNISPKTTLEINSIFETNSTRYNPVEESNSIFIKGSIMGSINSPESLIYVSGKNADKLEVLNDYGLNIHIISEKIDDCAYIKMFRSIYTKGVTTLIHEVFSLSENIGLTKKLFESLINTEGENFEKQAKSRIKNLVTSRERKFQEMDEIFNFLNEASDKKEFDIDHTMTNAIRNKLKKIK
jgi:3-hydroxyisobutyrate dehydrogenase-like beta-hydroxyacid dehydrogenase